MKCGRRAALLGAAVSVAAVLGATVGVAPPAQAAKPAQKSTTASVTSAFVLTRPLFVDPHSAARTAQLQETDERRAALLDKIAGQPSATWVGNWWPTTTLSARIVALQDAARAAGATRTYVLYAIPDRDCGSHSSGGLDPAGYRSFVEAFVAGLGGWPAIVIVEPDALAQLDCLSENDRQTRLELLRHSTATLRLGSPHSRVYLDAGHSAWVSAPEMTRRLSEAGVTYARGFSLNVSNFYSTEQQITYGQAIASRLTGDKRFVVDTSRNGLGPWTGSADPTPWCNPPGRALGAPPAHASPTGPAGLDSVLWLKTAGASDGTCRPGEPTAGTFWPDYAVGLAERATW